MNFIIARTFHALTSRVLGIKIEVEGEEYLETRPAVFMSNHQSMLDILSVAKTMPMRTSMMSKNSLRFTPLGPFMIMSGAVFIDRGNNARAVRSLEAAGELMKAKQISLWMYPEGTRHLSQVPDMLPLKKGGFHLAIQAGIPIVPVVTENYWRLYHKDVFESGVVKVRVLPPVPTVGLTAKDVPDLAAKVRNQMIDALRDISVKVPAEKTTDVSPSGAEEAQDPLPSITMSSDGPSLSPTPSPGPSDRDGQISPPPETSRAIDQGLTSARQGSTASIASSSTGVRTASENGTETEEDEGMILVGRPT